MPQHSRPHLVEVTLASAARAAALVEVVADPRAMPRRSRLQLALGGTCPHCGQGIVILAVGTWPAATLELALRHAGRCRHQP